MMQDGITATAEAAAPPFDELTTIHEDISPIWVEPL
jgi:hypothetical protein